MRELLLQQEPKVKAGVNNTAICSLLLWAFQEAWSARKKKNPKNTNKHTTSPQTSSFLTQQRGRCATLRDSVSELWLSATLLLLSGTAVAFQSLLCRRRLPSVHTAEVWMTVTTLCAHIQSRESCNCFDAFFKRAVTWMPKKTNNPKMKNTPRCFQFLTRSSLSSPSLLCPTFFTVVGSFFQGVCV